MSFFTNNFLKYRVVQLWRVFWVDTASLIKKLTPWRLLCFLTFLRVDLWPQRPQQMRGCRPSSSQKAATAPRWFWEDTNWTWSVSQRGGESEMMFDDWMSEGLGGRHSFDPFVSLAPPLRSHGPKTAAISQRAARPSCSSTKPCRSTTCPTQRRGFTAAPRRTSLAPCTTPSTSPSKVSIFRNKLFTVSSSFLELTVSTTEVGGVDRISTALFCLQLLLIGSAAPPVTSFCLREKTACWPAEPAANPNRSSRGPRTSCPLRVRTFQLISVSV